MWQQGLLCVVAGCRAGMGQAVGTGHHSPGWGKTLLQTGRLAKEQKLHAFAFLSCAHGQPVVELA